MDGREGHAVELGIIPPHVKVRHERHIREERLQSALVARDLGRKFLEVVQTVLRVLLLPLLAEMVLVEEVAEVLDHLADRILLDMLLRALEGLGERRPDRLRLRAKEPVQRLAAFL